MNFLSSLTRRALLLSAVLALGLPTAHAADGSVQLLQQWLKQTRAGQADFTQTVSNPKGPAQAPASGTFAFQRPDRFRWNYTAPYQQVIVSDGKELSTFDHDLNQVTITPVTQAFRGTPAAIFAGADLNQLFTLAAQPDANGLHWVEAKPKARDSNFDWIRIGLRATDNGPEVAELQLRDAFGQVSTMIFSHIVANPALPVDQFTFTPPKGASVIRQP